MIIGDISPLSHFKLCPIHLIFAQFSSSAQIPFSNFHHRPFGHIQYLRWPSLQLHMVSLLALSSTTYGIPIFALFNSYWAPSHLNFHHQPSLGTYGIPVSPLFNGITISPLFNYIWYSCLPSLQLSLGTLASLVTYGVPLS